MSGSTGAGNEVIMLLMGRDKQEDQCVSTIAQAAKARYRSGWPGWRMGAHTIPWGLSEAGSLRPGCALPHPDPFAPCRPMITYGSKESCHPVSPPHLHAPTPLNPILGCDQEYKPLGVLISRSQHLIPLAIPLNTLKPKFHIPCTSLVQHPPTHMLGKPQVSPYAPRVSHISTQPRTAPLGPPVDPVLSFPPVISLSPCPLPTRLPTESTLSKCSVMG